MSWVLLENWYTCERKDWVSHLKNGIVRFERCLLAEYLLASARVRNHSNTAMECEKYVTYFTTKICVIILLYCETAGSSLVPFQTKFGFCHSFYNFFAVTELWGCKCVATIVVYLNMKYIKAWELVLCSVNGMHNVWNIRRLLAGAVCVL